MAPELVGTGAIVILLLMLYLRIWVGVAMLFIGFWGVVIILDGNRPWAFWGQFLIGTCPAIPWQPCRCLL